ncbi:MAG: flagellar hook-associated protein 3 [Spirochaetales bacterium]|nr:flagellar hook-associated protein 3 [Spirochaetales bacterium]
MKRISTNMSNYDMQYFSRIRQWEMNNLQNKMADQTRIKNLRDDPIAAAHSTRYLSHITRLTRFSKNIETVQSNHRIAEGYLRESNNILHRIRELAIQGGNDTYTVSDKRIMGEEVNQLLKELLELANSRSGDGTFLFAGDKNQTKPYRIMEGNFPGINGKLATGVEYIGSINPGQAEISEGSYIDTNMPGNQIFWAEQQQIFSTVDGTSYQVEEDSTILVDGERIDLSVGDNVYAIIAKINTSRAAVQAHLDPVSNAIVLQTTAPHQLWLEDEGEGHVLQDLGILKGNGVPPHNLAVDSEIGGGSLFDMVIHLRNSLYEGNTIDIGGSALKGLTLAQDQVLAKMAEIGAKDERMQMVQGRLDYEIPEMKEKNSREVDLDFAKAITDLKMLEFNHKVALQTAARILQPTLLDFLR